MTGKRTSALENIQIPLTSALAVLNSFPGRGFAYDVRPSFDGNIIKRIILNGTVDAGSFEYTVTAENI